jgi:hypothetical protein
MFKPCYGLQSGRMTPRPRPSCEGWQGVFKRSCRRPPNPTDCVHTRHYLILATIATIVLQTPGCTNGSVARGAAQVDSAAREARRREFLAEQQAETDSALRAARRDRPLLAEVVVEHPTLVAFFPRAEMAIDSVALKQRLRMYREVAESSGWRFEQRYSERLRITDRRSNALYGVPLPRDTTGVVLVAPGVRPQVWLGTLSQSTLGEGLQAFLNVLRVKGSRNS